MPSQTPSRSRRRSLHGSLTARSWRFRAYPPPPQNGARGRPLASDHEYVAGGPPGAQRTSSTPLKFEVGSACEASVRKIGVPSRTRSSEPEISQAASCLSPRTKSEEPMGTSLSASSSAPLVCYGTARAAGRRRVSSTPSTSRLRRRDQEAWSGPECRSTRCVLRARSRTGSRGRTVRRRGRAPQPGRPRSGSEFRPRCVLRGSRSSHPRTG
jgi:hypothetical protein